MALADDVVTWIEENATPAGATVHAHRQPDDHGVADVLVVALERQGDSYLFGGGPGFGRGGESENRLGLWWIVNTRRHPGLRRSGVVSVTDLRSFRRRNLKPFAASA